MQDECHTPRSPHVGTPSRRAVITAAAWTVPAVTLAATSPAFANSPHARKTTTLMTPGMRVPASGNVTVTATVLDSGGAAVAGEAVSFTGPSGATFSPSSTTTDSAGIATTTLDLRDRWATPGSTATVAATAGGETITQGFSVLGSNVLVFGKGFTSTPEQTELVFPSPVKQIAAGTYSDADPYNHLEMSLFSVALLQDGTVWTKGTNETGQLGDGTKTNRSTWAQVEGLSPVIQIAAGWARVVVLHANGTVSNWGKCNGPNGPVDQLTPVKVPGLTTVKQIAHSPGLEAQYSGCSFALLTDGSVKAWGTNMYGNAGTGIVGSNPWNTPTQVAGLTSGVAQVGAGGVHAGAVLSDGTVRTWGNGGSGQLGNGATGERWSPGTVTGISGQSALLAGGVDNTYVLMSDGSVRSSGASQNSDGGETTTFDVVPGLTSGVVQISVTNNTGHALMDDGSIRAWGFNGDGQLGNGTTTDQRPAITLTTIPAGRAVSRLAEPSAAARTTYLVLAT